MVNFGYRRSEEQPLERTGRRGGAAQFAQSRSSRFRESESGDRWLRRRFPHGLACDGRSGDDLLLKFSRSISFSFSFSFSVWFPGKLELERKMEVENPQKI